MVNRVNTFILKGLRACPTLVFFIAVSSINLTFLMLLLSNSSKPINTKQIKFIFSEITKYVLSFHGNGFYLDVSLTTFLVYCHISLLWLNLSRLSHYDQLHSALQFLIMYFLLPYHI